MHNNNFGFLRLLFATLVIVSHSAEIIDGNRSREALTSLFGILTFGEIAVDGFFLISGYLIAKSYEQSSTIFDYLQKRVMRIYPGFLVAFIVCVCLVGPWVGMTISGPRQVLDLIADALFLRSPSVSAFVGLPVPTLNGSMWTIVVEFRCYLFVIFLGALGFYRNKWPLLLFTAVLLTLMELKCNPWIPRPAAWLLGYPITLTRLFGIFCVGSCYYVFRAAIPYNATGAIAASAALLIFMSQSIVAETAFAIFGGYLIFWIALTSKSRILQSINNRNDISYGVYLYAWPVQSALVYFLHLRSPGILMAVTIPIVYAVGLLSWRFVERPFTRKGKPIEFK